jgi:hypothetical protein
MTNARIHHRTVGILAIALIIALALSTTAVPASGRGLNFRSAGWMVQQPLPPEWACAMRRALSSGPVMFQCRESPV